MSEDQAPVHDVLTERHATRRVSDARFNAVKARFGEPGVIDPIAVSGYYGAVAMTQNLAAVKLPEGVPSPLPELRRQRRGARRGLRLGCRPGGGRSQGGGTRNTAGQAGRAAHGAVHGRPARDAAASPGRRSGTCNQNVIDQIIVL
jgi:hypothetical protein